MMIYNCCSLGCNYYNYRFFVRASRGTGPGPGPDALFAPSLSMRLHPFGPSFLRASLFLFFVCFSRSHSRFHSVCLSVFVGTPVSFPLCLLSSLLLLLREQRPEIYGGSAVETGFGSWIRARASRVLALDCSGNLCLCSHLCAGRSVLSPLCLALNMDVRL